MSAYVGMSRRIKDALVAMVTAIQYDIGEGPEPAFGQILDSNRQVFNGWPNVQVLPGNEAISLPTTGQSDKTPDYILRVRIPLEDTAQSQTAAFNQMYDLSDLVIDAVTEADHHGQLDDGRGPMGITMMNASQGDWVELATSNGVNLTFDLNVNVTYSKDL